MQRIVLSCIIIILTSHMIPFSVTARELTLSEAIAEALKHNRELLAANQKLNATATRFWEMISPENPELFIEYEDIPTGSHSFSDYGMRRIGIAQEFEFPLVYYYKGKSHMYTNQHARAEYLQMRNDVQFRVEKSFYNLLLLKDKKQIFNEIRDQAVQFYNKAKIRVEIGESSPYEALKAKVNVAEVENQILKIEKEYDIALAEFALLLGHKNRIVFSVNGDFIFSPVQLTKDSVLELAARNHPLFLNLDAHEKKMKMEQRISWLELIPNIGLKYFRQEFQGDSNNRAWGGEIGIVVPLWSPLKNQGKIRAANYERKAAKYEAEYQKRKILVDVEKAFSKLMLAESQVLNYRENTLKEVEQLAHIAQRSYEEGEMNYLEVTEAVRTLLRTKAGYSETLYNYFIARAELENAVGTTLFH